MYQVVGDLPAALPPSIRGLPFLHFCTADQLRTLGQPVLGVWRTNDDRRYHRNTLAATFGPPVTAPLDGRWRVLVITMPERPGTEPRSIRIR